MRAQMSFADFLHATATGVVPPELGAALQALRQDACGQWGEAQALAQAAGRPDFCVF